jgi:hypothetical protein
MSTPRYFLLAKFKAVADGVADPACQAALHKLCSLFSISDLLEGEQVRKTPSWPRS